MRKNEILITTERMNICIASDDDMRELIDLQTDAHLKEVYSRMLAACQQQPELRPWTALWCMRLTDGTRVGELGFKGMSPDGVIEIGYGILPEFWGKGYMTEAVTAVVSWAAAQPEVSRIEAETVPENIASQRVLAKSGFVPTGTMGEQGPRFVWNGTIS